MEWRSASNVVDIYNTSTNTWSTAALSQARDYLAATSAGNNVFFGGGYNININQSNVVDIYDTSSSTWSTTSLSVGRSARGFGGRLGLLRRREQRQFP